MNLRCSARALQLGTPRSLFVGALCAAAFLATACGGRSFEESEHCLDVVCGRGTSDRRLDSPEMGAQRDDSRTQRKQLVFVSNQDSGSVSVIDPSRDEVLQAIHTGGRPRALCVSPNGHELYVALGAGAGNGNAMHGGVAVIDVKRRIVVRTLQSGVPAENFDITPDGKQLVVSNSALHLASIVDIASDAIVNTISFAGVPEAVAVRPDGEVTYVASPAENQLYVLDRRSDTVRKHIAMGSAPSSIAFTRDGREAFVTNELSASLTVIDALTHTPNAVIDLDATTSGDIVPRPVSATLAPDGVRLYVTMGRNGGIAVIDIAARRVIHTLAAIGPHPWGIGISESGEKLYVANGASNDVSVVDAASGRVLQRLQVGASPWGVTVAHYRSEVQHASPSSP